MLLPRIAFLSVVSLAACALNGCSTIYSDTFSNKRNRFVPPPPQKSVLPPEMQQGGALRQGGGANPGAPLGDGGAAGGVLPAASGIPMIPGL